MWPPCAPSLCTNPSRQLSSCEASCEVQRSVACKLKAMGWVDWLHWWVRWSTASHIRHSRRATWTLVGATRVPLWSHLAADVSLGNRRRQCFRGQRQLLWYADSTPCWSQDHSLPSALTLNDAVAYPARTPNLASGSAIKDGFVGPVRDLIWRSAACIHARNDLG